MEDKYHIQMEDISEYPIERSADNEFWEEIPYEQLFEEELSKLPEEKVKRFFGVLRNGGWFKLHDYYYRIKAS